MTQNNVNSKNPLVQYAYTLLTAAPAINAAIPKDNTIPQQTEGVEVMTCSITPTNASNILVIKAYAWGYNLTSFADFVMALFQDATANALAAIEGNYINFASAPNRTCLFYKMTAGTTSSTTFKIRCGNSTGVTTYINPGIFGGVQCSYMEIMEIKA